MGNPKFVGLGLHPEDGARDVTCWLAKVWKGMSVAAKEELIHTEVSMVCLSDTQLYISKHVIE